VQELRIAIPRNRRPLFLSSLKRSKVALHIKISAVIFNKIR